MGIKAAAMSLIPRSVASKLNCDAAFRVSRTSILMPRLLMYFLSWGLIGRMLGPRPNINISAFWHDLANRPVTCPKTHGKIAHTRPRPDQVE